MNCADVKIGENNKFSQFIALGTAGEHVAFYDPNSPHYNKYGDVIIGNNNIIREFTTIHAGIDGETVIGDDCFIMAHCHIGHDSKLGNKVIMSDHSTLCGHTQLMDGVYMGMNSTTHPWTTIGAYSIVGCGCAVVKDVPPFLKYVTGKGCFAVNDVGMLRHGFSKRQIRIVKDYYGDWISGEWRSFHSCEMPKRIQSYLDKFMLTRNPDRPIAEITL